MIVVNFSHPLTYEQKAQVEALTGERIAQVIDRPARFDVSAPSIVSQVVALVDSVGLTADGWQTERLLVNPPALSIIAAAVLAELHGRMGYFPPLLRMRPVANSGPVRFEIAEVLNLQGVREQARERRHPAE